MTERGILDTSAVVLLGRLHIHNLPDEPVITAVTLAELPVGPLVATTPKERAARQGVLQQAESQPRSGQVAARFKLAAMTQ